MIDDNVSPFGHIPFTDMPEIIRASGVVVPIPRPWETPRTEAKECEKQ
jgi:hypothetical protein